MPASQPERVVLGIDAAWTAANPSGVALAARTGDVWRLVAVAASFEEFIALSGDGMETDRASLVNAAARLAGRVPDLVAALCACVTVPMDDTEYDRISIVRFAADGRASLEVQRYGASSRP